jgi:histidinol phosphatase-like enzyme (inositol monophosphatase family)
MSPEAQAATTKRLDFAVAAAKAAGAIALRYFQDGALRVETKLDRSVVTEADRLAERQLRAAIGQDFPDDAIVGEEYGEKEGKSGWTWYLDPIDGTQAFVRGVPLFGTLIGAEYRGESKVGVIFLPALGEIVYAARGHGCFWERGMHWDGLCGFSQVARTKAEVSPVSEMKSALFCTTWMQSFVATDRVDVFTRLCEATGVFRGWGDCYGYALVATGRAEIMVDPQLNVWDAAPMQVILEEAGGVYTTFEGQPDIHGGSGVATNGRLHASTLAVIKGG